MFLMLMCFELSCYMSQKAGLFFPHLVTTLSCQA
ncbi:hypothetical protein Gohar_004578 [Gossypium harknessii]|uniref:Uncharacterized protein n=1 Tax=Gossypium harknessii TaxID=34285 RepID=A0A7J9H5C7_9ROSI|nr:hypothetical protein [Gossypium harknessii]